MNTKDPDHACACGSGASLARCCGPILEDPTQAHTPEALMRSRYTAHVFGHIEHLRRTHDPSSLQDFDALAAEAWSKGSTWLGLTVVHSEQGGERDGFVEFRARFSRGGIVQTHHERSRFVRMDGRWLYVDGKRMQAAAPAKTGRNEPCPCKSGKKFKKCCGART